MSRHTLFRTTALDEMGQLTSGERTRLLEQLRLLSENPSSPHLNTCPLRDYPGMCRLRMEGLRVFYQLDPAFIDVLAVRRRNEHTYHKGVKAEELHPKLQNPPPLNFERDEEILQERNPQGVEAPELLTPQVHPLPQALTLEWLQSARIPSQYFKRILRCQSEEDVLALDVPSEVTEKLINRLYAKNLKEILQDPRYLVNSMEELEAFLQGKVSDLLLHLDPDQEEAVTFRIKGPALLRGGPGTGKTVVALHRAVRHAEEMPGGRLLFCTYTRALKNYAENLLQRIFEERQLSCQVDVKTVDQLTRSLTTGKIIGETSKEARQKLKHVLSKDNHPLADTLGSRYLLEEFDEVIDAWGVETLDEYLNLERVGRKRPLREEERRQVWSWYTQWKELLRRDGLTTWNQARQQAAMKAQGTHDVVIVDEAQDLTPVGLRLVIRHCRNLQKLLVAADSNQSLYHKSFSWKMVHADLDMRGRTFVLRKNHRSTRQIHEVLRDLAWKLQLNPSDFPTAPIREGPQPGWYPYGTLNFDDLAEKLVSTCRAVRLPISAVGVLCYTQDRVDEVVAELNFREVPAVTVKDEGFDVDFSAVKVLTYHSAKGLEFPVTVVLDVNRAFLPRDVQQLPEEERESHLQLDRHLLFVACSRAMRSLTVGFQREQPSPFLQDLDRSLWQPV